MPALDETVKNLHDTAVRYAQEVFQHDLALTSEDVAHFTKTHQGSTNLNWDLYQASAEVSDFVRLRDRERWANLGAEILWGGDANFTQYNSVEVTDPVTKKKVERPLTWQEIQEHPGWYADPAPEDQKILDAWYALTPYRLWTLVEETIEWATDVLRENAYSMAAGGGHITSVAQAMVGQFEKVVKEWREEQG